MNEKSFGVLIWGLGSRPTPPAGLLKGKGCCLWSVLLEYCGIRGRVGLGLQEMQHEGCAQAEALAEPLQIVRAGNVRLRGVE